MTYDPNLHHRRSLQLQEYDYSQTGAYFITLCAYNRECLFGEVANGVMQLNDAGIMVQSVWNEIPSHYPGSDIDEFVIMPNHVHGIVVIARAGPRACADSVVGLTNLPQLDESGQPQGVALTGLSLPDIVHRFQNDDHKTVC